MKHCYLFLLALVTSFPLSAQSLDWSRSVGGTSSDASRSVAVDAAGNVYVTGTFGGTVDFDPGAGSYPLTASGTSNIFVQKLDPNGDFLWARAMTGTDISRSYAITVDGSGNVYSTGFFAGAVDFDPGAGTLTLNSGSAIWRDIYVQKLDASGNLVWAHGIGGANEDIGYGIALDGNGDVVVVGGFENTVDFDPGAGVATLSAVSSDVFVLKLDAAGGYVWAKGMTTGSFGGDDFAAAVATDAANDIYLTGTFGGEVDFDPGAGVSNLTALGVGFNAFVQKLDDSGNLVWVKQAATTSFADGQAIAVCANGDVLASGIFMDDIDGDPGVGTALVASLGGFDGYLYRLDASGNLVWFHTVGGVEDDYARAVAEDASGAIFLVGDFKDTVDFDPSGAVAAGQAVGDKDIFVQQLNANGSYANHLQMGGANAESVFKLVCAGQSQYLAGYFQGTADLDPYAAVASHTAMAAEDAYVLKLNGLVVATPAPAASVDCRAFPNPSAGRFQIAGIAPSRIQHIQLTNAAGTVIPMAWEGGQPLEIDLTDHPAGIYFVTLRMAGEVTTLRLIRN